MKTHARRSLSGMLAAMLMLPVTMTVAGVSDAGAATDQNLKSQLPVAEEAPTPRVEPAPRPLVDSLVVDYRRGVTPRDGADVRGEDQAGVDLALARRAPVMGLREVTLRRPVSEARARRIATRMERDKDVTAVYPNLVSQPYSTDDLDPAPAPNDPLYLGQWDMWERSFGAALNPASPHWAQTTGINLRYAWARKAGRSPVIGVIDGGHLDHPDLARATLPGYDFISDTFLANDGDGRDADPLDPGNQVSAEDIPTPGPFAKCPVKDKSGWHGGHVAGTIAAEPNNGIGVAGIVPDARIVPVRVIGRCGGLSIDIVEGALWAVGESIPGVPDNPNPASVINMSLGSNNRCDDTLYRPFFDTMESKYPDVTVVVAAGNENVNVAGVAPAGCNSESQITVAATNAAGSRAYYSNFGKEVDLAAPGGETHRYSETDIRREFEITSTVDSGTKGPQGPAYGPLEGTSMAAPHVTGIVALMQAAHPNWSPERIRRHLQQTSSAFPEFVSDYGKTTTCTQAPKTCGAGILNGGLALDVTTPPGPVGTAVATFYSNTLANVAWNAPRGPVSGYTITAYATNGAVIAQQDAASSPTLMQIPLAYYGWLTVTPRNRAGTGPSVTSHLAGHSAQTVTTAHQVSNVTGFATSPNSVAVTWEPADSGPAPTGYVAIIQPTGQVCRTTTTSCEITGVPANTPMVATVLPYTDRGVGLASFLSPQFSIGPSAGTPSSPTGKPTVADVGDGSATVTWAAVDGTTGYRVESDSDGAVCWTTTTTCTVRGLTNGKKYQFRVIRVGEGGASTPSAWSAKATPLIPTEIEVRGLPDRIPFGQEVSASVWVSGRGDTTGKVNVNVNGSQRCQETTTGSAVRCDFTVRRAGNATLKVKFIGSGEYADSELTSSLPVDKNR